MKLSKKQTSGGCSSIKKELSCKGIVSKTVGGIKEIVPIIHRVKLRLKDGDDSRILKVFNISAFHLMNKTEGTRAPNYQAVGYGNFGNNKYTIWTGRKMEFLPKYMFSVISPPQKRLFSLACKIPEIEISSVEYSIDIFCDDYAKVSNLFYLLRRYLYFPYRDRTDCRGGDFDGVDCERTENCAWRVWNKAQGKKCLTVYERGPDSKKKGLGWKTDDVDRVRIEYLAKNESKVFKKFGITRLSEFVKKPYFCEIMSNKFNFRRFKSNLQFPSDWNDFNTRDNSGYLECFQEEYIKAKQKCKNVSQCIEKVDSLSKFYQSIVDCMVAFDGKWARRYKNNANK